MSTNDKEEVLDSSACPSSGTYCSISLLSVLSLLLVLAKLRENSTRLAPYHPIEKS